MQGPYVAAQENFYCPIWLKHDTTHLHVAVTRCMSFVKIRVEEAVLFLLDEGYYIDTRANIKFYNIPKVRKVLAKYTCICYVTKAVTSSLVAFTGGT
jgi:hypothetical protein